MKMILEGRRKFVLPPKSVKGHSEARHSEVSQRDAKIRPQVFDFTHKFALLLSCPLQTSPSISTMARNTDVSPHIGKLSRSKLFAKKGLYKRQHKAAPAPAAAAPSTAAPSFYPSEDVKVPKKSRKSAKPTKLRSSITKGTVLILLAGRFRGKRVVFLDQLASGLLLVTGPFKVNGVPLRRVNAAYVIATSTKVDLGDFKVDAKINDAYFSKPASASRTGSASEFFGDKKEKKEFPAEKSADQKTVDKAVLAALKATPNLSKYLAASFGLTKGQHPHLLKF